MTAVQDQRLQQLFDEHMRVRVALEELLYREEELMSRLSKLLLAVPKAEREGTIRTFVERAGRKIEAEL